MQLWRRKRRRRDGVEGDGRLGGGELRGRAGRAGRWGGDGRLTGRILLPRKVGVRFAGAAVVPGRRVVWVGWYCRMRECVGRKLIPDWCNSRTCFGGFFICLLCLFSLSCFYS